MALAQTSIPVHNSLTIPLPGAPTDGNLVVLIAWTTSLLPAGAMSGWTLGPSAQSGLASPGGQGSVAIYYRVASGLSAPIVLPNYPFADSLIVIREYDGFTGTPTLVDSDSVSTTAAGTGTTVAGGSVTLPHEGIVVAASLIDEGDGHNYAVFTPDADLDTFLNSVFAYNVYHDYGADLASAPAGTYSPVGTLASNFHQPHGSVLAAFTGDPPPPPPPPPPPEPGTVIDWNDDGLAVGPNDDITADVMSWTITRGASAEITGGAQPGGATLMLRRLERDGLYNPWYAAGPLYGKLRDGRRVHIAINDDGTLSPPGTVKGLFAGRITDITPLASQGPDHVPITEIVCEDPLAGYGRTNVNIPDSRTRSHRELRIAVLDAIGETRYDLDSEIGTMPLSSAEGDAFGILSRINAANGTRHFAKPSDAFADWYRYTTYNRQHKLAGVADASLDAGSDHVTDTSGWRLSADTVINQQTATVEQLRFPDRKITVWEPDALPITVTTTLQTIWATFDDYVDGAELDISHSGSALTTTFTSFGRSAKITLVSSGTSKVARFLVVGHLVERGTAVSVVIDDAASQAAPRGVRAGQEISGDYVGVKAMADGIARHLVWRYGSPQMRPTLTVTNWFPEQFELDLYDLIAFSSGQFAASGVLFEIVGLTHVADLAAADAQSHTTTYVLQECRVQTPTDWFVLDTSELDSSDVLAY